MKINTDSLFYKFYQWDNGGNFPQNLGEYIVHIIEKMFLCFVFLAIAGGVAYLAFQTGYCFVKEYPFVAGAVLVFLVALGIFSGIPLERK